MSEIPQALAVGSDGAIAQDIKCTRCGYNLRGLDPSRRCPECNAPVAQSMHGNLLRYADPRWLETLRRGMSVKLWTIVVWIVGTFAGAIITSIGVPEAVMLVVMLSGGALGLWAAFLITTQEPRIALDEDPITLRKVVRTCAILSLAGDALQGGGAYLAHGYWFELAGTSLGLAAIVNYFGEFIFLRRFARRIPDEALAKSTTTVMWGTVAVMVVAGVGGFVAALVAFGTGGSGGPPPVFVAVGAFLACFVVLAGLVFLLWYIRLLVRYRDAFAAAAAESRWSTRPTAPPVAGEGPVPPAP